MLSSGEGRLEIGRTQGRGRQDRFRRQALAAKTIFVYPLANDLRAQLNLPADAGGSALTATGGLEGAEWAEHEFGGAELGDARLSRRLVEIAAAKARVPDRTFSGIARGDWATTQAWYRLIDQPDETAVTPANILAPHRKRTIRRRQWRKKPCCARKMVPISITTVSISAPDWGASAAIRPAPKAGACTCYKLRTHDAGAAFRDLAQ